MALACGSISYWHPPSSGRETGKEWRHAPQKNVEGSQAYAKFGTIVSHYLKIVEHAQNTPTAAAPLCSKSLLASV